MIEVPPYLMLAVIAVVATHMDLVESCACLGECLGTLAAAAAESEVDAIVAVMVAGLAAVVDFVD